MATNKKTLIQQLSHPENTHTEKHIFLFFGPFSVYITQNSVWATQAHYLPCSSPRARYTSTDRADTPSGIQVAQETRAARLGMI